jgi:hypothetical protein
VPALGDRIHHQALGVNAKRWISLVVHSTSNTLINIPDSFRTPLQRFEIRSHQRNSGLIAWLRILSSLILYGELHYSTLELVIYCTSFPTESADTSSEK